MQNSYLEEMLKQGTPYNQIKLLDTEKYAKLVEKLKNEPERKAVKMNVPYLDNLAGGFEAGRLYVLTAPTKQGKTTLAQTFMYNLAKAGTPSMIFSYEMGWREITSKFWLMDGQKFPATDLPMFVPLEMHSGGGDLQLQWMFEAMAKAKLENNVQFVVIDHLHFLLPLKDFNNTSFIIGGIVRELKKMSVMLNLPILLIAHLQKIKSDKAPELSDIRDSSFIAQEADVVFIMYREIKKNLSTKVTEQDDFEEEVFTQKAVLSVGANRIDGSSRRVKLWHDGTKFIAYENQDKTEEVKQKEFVQFAKKVIH